MRNRCAVGIIAVVVLGGFACGKKKGVVDPGPSLPVGSYTLKSLNGLSIPVTILLQPGYKLELTGAVLTIEAGSKFINASTYRKTLNGGVTTPDEKCVGSYTLSGTSISFTESGTIGSVCGVVEQETGTTRGVSRSYTGTWDGANRITIDFDVTTHSIYEK